jgi:hypothetical protein
MRAPFNVLVYPYHRLPDGELKYALFKRSDEGWWQAMAGGGEGKETPQQAAKREALKGREAWAVVVALTTSDIIAGPKRTPLVVSRNRADFAELA